MSVIRTKVGANFECGSCSVWLGTSDLPLHETQKICILRGCDLAQERSAPMNSVVGTWDYPENDKTSLWVECSECAVVVPIEEAGTTCPSCQAKMKPILKEDT